MGSDVGIYEALFFVSLTVNLCIWLHFGLFGLIDRLAAPERQGTRITRLRLAHKHSAAFMKCLYVDTILFISLPIATVVLTVTSGALSSPFEATYPKELRLLFSVLCGIFTFLIFRVCLADKNSPIKYMHIIIYVVSLATSAAVLLTGEDAAMGLILAVSTGDVPLLNACQLLEVMRVQSARYRRVVLFTTVYISFIVRAFLPLGCISISLINGSPFSMSYPSIFFFFVGILFFGAINTWQVNVTVSRLCCRKRETVVEVPYREFGCDSEPKPEDLAVASASIEVPPSYNEVCGDDGTFFPAVFPARTGTSSPRATNSTNEFLTLDVNALPSFDEVMQTDNSLDQSMEATDDTSSLV